MATLMAKMQQNNLNNWKFNNGFFFLTNDYKLQMRKLSILEEADILGKSVTFIKNSKFK